MSATPSRAPRRATYAGIFLLALSTLMLEVLMTRITSVIAWYHLAFFVISLAMLGMTAGAVFIFVRPELFKEADIPKRLAQSTSLFALSAPVCVGVAMVIELRPIEDLMGFVALLAYGGALAVPFGLSGVALTLALTRAKLPASTAYGVDLVGAAAGCALVIPLLWQFDAPSAVLVTAAVAALAGGLFSLARGKAGEWAFLRSIGLIAVCLVAAGMNTLLPPAAYRPAFVKGDREDPNALLWVGWNTHSRVDVGPTIHPPPRMWAGSHAMPEALRGPTPQRILRIDGAAETMMFERGDQLERHEHIDWDITSFAHRLRPEGPAAVIGVGGGRDVIVAARAGHSPIVGVELNGLIVALHRDPMRSFSGLVDIPGLELIHDEARSFMVRERRRFSVITMSLIDTWASTGAGAYSLSENGLYTAEAWASFTDRLTDDGIFTVSRWYHERAPGETTRMLALAMETLYRAGAADPRAHLVLLQNDSVATLLLSARPFSEDDLDRVEAEAARMRFNLLATPRAAPEEGPLAALWGLDSQAAMWTWTSAQEFDLTPPTDARPFFFNMLSPTHWLTSTDTVDELDLSILGNLQATQTLVYATLVSLLLTLFTVLGPLFARRRELRAASGRALVASTLYFMLIGLGFMYVEIGLLSQLSVFLGHPTLALAVLLGGMISFAGVGSLLSNRLDVERNARLAITYPVPVFALVAVAAVAAAPVTERFVGADLTTRVLVSIVTVGAPALGMGICFPLGLRLVQARRALEGGADLGPWLWGINGAAGVCASGLALGTSMVWGVPTTLAVGAGCYALLAVATWALAPASSGSRAA